MRHLPKDKHSHVKCWSYQVLARNRRTNVYVVCRSYHISQKLIITRCNLIHLLKQKCHWNIDTLDANSTIFTNHNSITKSILKSKFACGTTFRFYCTYSRITSLDYIFRESDDRKNWTPSTNQSKAKQCKHIASQIIVQINLDGIHLRDRVKFA